MKIFCASCWAGPWATSRGRSLSEDDCSNAKLPNSCGSSPASYADVVARTDEFKRTLTSEAAWGGRHNRRSFRVIERSERKHTRSNARWCWHETWCAGNLGCCERLWEDATTARALLPDYVHSWCNCHLILGDTKSWHASSSRYPESYFVFEEAIANSIRVKSAFRLGKVR